MRVLLFSIVLSFCSVSFSKTHCICEVGKKTIEEAFYRIGCSMWLAQQSCDSKKVIQIHYGDQLIDFIPNLKNGDTIKNGFVGHWSGFYATKNYITDNLLSIAKKYQVKIKYENTACNPMDKPFKVQKFLMSLDIAKGSSIYVKGSQGVSIGLWEKFLMGRENLYAYASSNWSSPGFWSCKSIEGQNCVESFQAGETGLCYDRNQRETVKLTCSHTATIASNKRIYKWVRR